MTLSIVRQLPEEILDYIVSLSSRKTLTKLCFASKQLNRLATAHLYSNITLGTDGPYDEKTYISHLAHLFFTSPAYAALVTTVLVQSTWGPKPEYAEKGEEYPWPDIGTPESETLLRSILAKFALDDEENEMVYEKIKTGTNEDAIVALLLLGLPNLHRLDMNFGFCDDHSEFVSVFGLLADHVKLNNDQSSPQVDVMVKGEDDTYPNPPVHLAALLHMPNLRSIYGWKMGDHEGNAELDFGRLKPRSCSIEYIELRTSKVHHDDLRHLMNTTIPGKLKTFDYEIGCTWAWCDISHPDIMTSLQVHHETLENLGLSHEDLYPHQFGNDHEKPYPCDFKPFTALKRLKVAPVYVWGHEGFNNAAKLADRTTKEMLWKTLPKNLEQFWICRTESQEPLRDENDDTSLRFEADCLLPALDLVLQHRDEFPKLNNIRIEFSPKKWPKNKTLDSLESFCRRAECSGIQTTIILNHVGCGYVERKWGWDEDVEWGECFANQESEKRWIAVGEVKELAREIRETRDREKDKTPGVRRTECVDRLSIVRSVII